MYHAAFCYDGPRCNSENMPYYVIFRVSYSHGRIYKDANRTISLCENKITENIEIISCHIVMESNATQEKCTWGRANISLVSYSSILPISTQLSPLFPRACLNFGWSCVGSHNYRVPLPSYMQRKHAYRTITPMNLHINRKDNIE